MHEVHIRDARGSDRQAVGVVTLAAYEEYAAALPADVWRGYRDEIVATLADVGAAEQVVAELDGAIVGTALLYPAGTRLDRPDGSAVALEWPEMRLLAVAPAARGRGVGSAIVRECVRRARAVGAEAITLHTTDVMAAAMAMYERMGFSRAAELDFSPAEGVLVKGYRLGLRDQKP